MRWAADPTWPPPLDLLGIVTDTDEDMARAEDDADDAGLTEPTRRTRKRKPTLASVARQAAKASLEVAAYEVKPDGSIVVVLGKPGETKPEDDNEWRKVLLQ
jgi:hypothetical protein